MATHYSTNMTGARGLTRRSHVEGQKTSGDIRYWEDYYTTDATEVTTAVIQLAQLPHDSYFLPEKSWFFSEGLGGTSVVITSIGDEVDDDRYSTTDLAVTAASTVPLTVTTIPALLLSRWKITEATRIITATLTGTFPVTTAKKLVYSLAYRLA